MSSLKAQSKIPHPFWHNLFWCHLISWGADRSYYKFECSKCNKVYTVRVPKLENVDVTCNPEPEE